MAKGRANRRNRQQNQQSQGGGPAGQRPLPLGNDPIGRMMRDQAAKDQQQALHNLIGQIVSRQVATAMQGLGMGINSLAGQVQMQMLMMDSIRRILEKKGYVTKEEFEEQAMELQKITQRSHEISHDMEMDRDERIKKIVEECELEPDQAESLIDEVAKRMSGAGLEGVIQKEDDQPEEEQKEETPDS